MHFPFFMAPELTTLRYRCRLSCLPAFMAPPAASHSVEGTRHLHRAAMLVLPHGRHALAHRGRW